MSSIVQQVGPLRYAAAWLEARLLPLRLTGQSFEGALNLAEADPSGPSLPADTIAEMIRRITRQPILMRKRRCMRSGLLGYKHLRRAGLSPRLHFAIAPSSLSEPATRAHCWVTLDGEAVINEPDPEMVEIHVHPPEPQP